MLGITDYIRNDLEGVYTAELLRGAISMFFAVILTQILELGEARAYILIVALNGLRSMTGDTLPLRECGMSDLNFPSGRKSVIHATDAVLQVNDIRKLMS